MNKKTKKNLFIMENKQNVKKIRVGGCNKYDRTLQQIRVDIATNWIKLNNCSELDGIQSQYEIN